MSTTQNDGPIRSYDSYVAAQTRRKPILQSFGDSLKRHTTGNRECAYDCLEFFAGSDPPYHRTLDFNSLKSMLFSKRNGDDSLCGRLLVIEDISLEVIKLLGSTLDIDPLFFASHMDTTGIDIAVPRPSTARLPSLMRSERFLNLHYHRVVDFENALSEQTLFRDMNLRRKVKVLPQIKDVNIGLVRYCCSIIETAGKDGLWLGLVLVDAPISNSYVQKRQGDQQERNLMLQTRLFQGGSQDLFSNPTYSDDSDSEPCLSRLSTRETLMNCWKTEQPWGFNKNGPSLLSSSYYPLGLVAAEWMIYLELTFHVIKQQEYSPITISAALAQITVLSSDIHFLQRWLRRIMATANKINLVTYFLRQQMLISKEKASSAALMEDYEPFASRVENYGHRLETMVSVGTSVIQAIDSRRSFTEPVAISKLSYLALSFIPLTFVSGLFSMNERVAPGGSHFWLYFVVAIPLCTVVFLANHPPIMVFGFSLLNGWISKGGPAETQGIGAAGAYFYGV